MDCNGASEAAKVGAVASLVRSLTEHSLGTMPPKFPSSLLLNSLSSLVEMHSFRVLNCLTTFLALSIFSITISASIMNWYTLREQITLVPATGASTTSDTLLYNRTDVALLEPFSLQQRTTSTYFDRKQTSVATSYSSDHAIFSILKLVQAFAITALLFSGILSIYFSLVFFADFRAKILYSWGATGARRIAMLTSLFVVISVIISFLALTGITDALKTDNPVCTVGRHSFSFDEVYAS